MVSNGNLGSLVYYILEMNTTSSEKSQNNNFQGTDLMDIPTIDLR